MTAARLIASWFGVGFLPWAPGQPSTTGNSHCVDVAAMGPNVGLMSLGTCGMDSHPAICECDP